MISIIDNVREVGNQFLGDGKLLIIGDKPFIVSDSKKILEGDTVLIEYTHKQGDRGTNGDYDCGILTRIWDVDKGPFCSIDYKGIDLAGEGHSSNTYKVLARESDLPSHYIAMIANGTLKDGDKVSLDCRSITREELKTITFARLDIKVGYSSSDEIEKIKKTKQLFNTLPITSETLDGMKVVSSPIRIEEFESQIEMFEMSDIQKSAIESWDGKKALTLYPNGTINYNIDLY